MSGRRKRSAGGSVGATAVDLGTDKLYFRIGEVARIVGVPAYVLRYWESEFPMVRPDKGRNGQRIYRRKDVETLLRIKHLLHERRFTIEGARRQLRGDAGACPPAAPAGAYLARRSLDRVIEALDDLERMVAEPPRPELADPAAYVATFGATSGTLGAGSGAEASGTRQPLLDRPARR